MVVDMIHVLLITNEAAKSLKCTVDLYMVSKAVNYDTNVAIAKNVQCKVHSRKRKGSTVECFQHLITNS
jgi:hypothetical protein